MLWIYQSPIESWDVSKVDSMNNVFGSYCYYNYNYDDKCNPAIGAWDVSSSTSFEWMFSDMTAFDQDLSTWDVPSSADFRNMFVEQLLLIKIFVIGE